MPVHGEPLHLSEHAALARRLGVPQVVTCTNGDVVQLAPGPAGIVDELPAGRLYKDGSLIIEASSRTVADRRRLSFAGMISVALAVTERGDLAADPDLAMRGVPEATAKGEAMHAIALAAVVDTFHQLPRARRRDPEALTEAVTRGLRAAVAAHWGKRPNCQVHVLVV